MSTSSNEHVLNMICETDGQWMETGPVDSPSNNNWASFIHRWAPCGAQQLMPTGSQYICSKTVTTRWWYLITSTCFSIFSVLIFHFSVFHLFINLYHPCLSFYISPWRFAVVKAIYPPGSPSPLGAFQDNAVTETSFCLCHLSVMERVREWEGGGPYYISCHVKK